MSIKKNIKEPKKDQKDIEQVFQERDSYEKSTKSKRTEIQTIWDAYNGKMTDKEYPWQSDKFIPKMRTEISYIMPFIFSGDPEIEVEGVGDEDKFLASILEKMVNYRLRNDLNAFEKISSWVLQAIGFGTSIIRVIWEFKTQGGKVVKDQPRLDVPNILDKFCNPLIASIDEQVSTIERSTKTLQEIKDNPVFKNTDKVKPKGKFEIGRASCRERV